MSTTHRRSFPTTIQQCLSWVRELASGRDSLEELFPVWPSGQQGWTPSEDPPLPQKMPCHCHQHDWGSSNKDRYRSLDNKVISQTHRAKQIKRTSNLSKWVRQWNSFTVVWIFVWVCRRGEYDAIDAHKVVPTAIIWVSTITFFVWNSSNLTSFARNTMQAKINMHTKRENECASFHGKGSNNHTPLDHPSLVESTGSQCSLGLLATSPWWCCQPEL